MANNKKNKIKYNLKNVHYAVLTEDESGSVSWGTPYRFPVRSASLWKLRAIFHPSTRMGLSTTNPRPTTAMREIWRWRCCRKVSGRTS